jgi:predicted  nucleic acid-binding Zn-ribbon protein
MDTAECLLELQRLDSHADGLRARRAELPERAALRECDAEAVTLEAERGRVEEGRLALAAEERRLEGEVAEVGGRAREVEAKLYSGEVKAVSELEGLQLELDSFRRRKGELEEEELAMMEQVEAAEGELQALGERRDALDARVGELGAALAAAEAAIDAELAELAETRAGVAPGLPAEVLDTYTKLRALERLGGQALARFEGGRCIGCRVTLPINDATRIRRAPHDVFVQCPRCNRLLVR